MGSLRTVLAVAGLAIAFAAITAIAAGELAAVYRPSLHRIGRWIRPESVRIALAQAGLASIPVPAWIAARVTVAVAAATVAWRGFRLPVLGLLAFLVVYHLIGPALGFRRGGYESRGQDGLLHALGHGSPG